MEHVPHWMLTTTTKGHDKYAHIDHFEYTVHDALIGFLATESPVYLDQKTRPTPEQWAKVIQEDEELLFPDANVKEVADAIRRGLRAGYLMTVPHHWWFTPDEFEEYYRRHPRLRRKFGYA